MNSPDSRYSPTQQRARSGFTLVEMIVVISIISVLAGLSVMVGTAVINSGKSKATLGVIETLDEALVVYINQKGNIPPALVEVKHADLPSAIQGLMPIDGFNVKHSAFFPAVDGRGSEDASRNAVNINSVGYFIESVSVVAKAQTILSNINPEYLHRYSDDETLQPFMLTAFDAWGNPIRYVHPKFDGIIERDRRMLSDAGDSIDLTDEAEGFFLDSTLPVNADTRIRLKNIRRNRLIKEDYPTTVEPPADLLPDSDGGKTVGSRPYFYSAGPDGDPSTLDDNIYSISPQHVDPGVL